MSTAATGSGHGYDAALDDPAGDAIEAADLLDDPRTDAEALCLCSLLWSPTSTARGITAALTAADFYRPLYAELYAVIADQIATGTPHDPASIAAVLTQAGKMAGYRGEQLARALTQATMAGSPPEAAGHYAATVAAAAYRRGFHTAAAALTQAAEQLPQDQLFEHLVSIGRERRTATDRLQRIQAALS